MCPPTQVWWTSILPKPVIALLLFSMRIPFHFQAEVIYLQLAGGLLDAGVKLQTPPAQHHTPISVCGSIALPFARCAPLSQAVAAVLQLGQAHSAWMADTVCLLGRV